MALKSAVAARRNNSAQLWLWSTPESKSHFYVGIHPTKHCLARLRWAENDNLPNLLSAVHSGICPRELYEFAVADHPRFLAELRESVAGAAQWELKRYGCLLIPRTIQNHNTKRLGNQMPRQIFIEHVTGRTVQQIVLTQDDDGYEIEIQFTDKTGFHIELEMKMLVDLIELRDWADGNGKLIKKFL